MKWILSAVALSMFSSSVFAERTPLIAKKVFGFNYEVIARSEKPFALEFCVVYAGNGNLRIDINNDKHSRCNSLPLSGITESDDVETRFRNKLDFASRRYLRSVRIARTATGVLILASTMPFLKGQLSAIPTFGRNLSWAGFKRILPSIVAGAGGIEIGNAFFVKNPDTARLAQENLLGDQMIVVDDAVYSVAKRALKQVSNDLRSERLKLR